MPNTERNMSTNYVAEMNQLIAKYENQGMGIMHGLQKDNIQNSWGAKKIKSGTGFKVEIEIIEKDGFNALTFTDSGTVGLTGTKYEILEDVSSNIDFRDDNERLANFETHKNLGLSRDQNTGGFIGQGKMMSNFHSKDNAIYFDSLREDNEYLIGSRRFDPPNLQADFMNIKMAPVKWGDDAMAKLSNLTAGKIKALDKVGTRIIIVNPTDEVIEYVKTDQLLKDIQNTWWEILLKYQRIDGIYVRHSGVDKKAECPEFFIDAMDENDQKIIMENRSVANIGKIKTAIFGFADQDLAPNYNGLTIQRAQMPINQAENLYDTKGTPWVFPTIPDSHKKRFFGIIILDEKLSNQIRPFEHETHYRIDRPGRGYAPFDNLKNTCNEFGIEKLLEKHNLIRSEDDPDERARELTKKDKDEINDIFRENGVGSVVIGRRSKFIISLKNSTNLKENNFLNDEVNMTFQIKNKILRQVTANVKIDVFDEEHHLVENLLSITDVDLISGANKVLDHVTISLDKPKYENGMIYDVVCSAEIEGQIFKGNKMIYVNRLRETEMPDFFLSPSIDEWPSEIKRVNTDEILKGVNCLISSNTLDERKVFFDCQLYNKEGGRPLNGKIYKSNEMTLEPHGTIIVDDMEDITLNDTITEGIGEGEIYLRFTLRAAEPFDDYRVGDQLSSAQILIFFNCDPPKSGIFEYIGPRNLGANYAQAKVKPNETTNGLRCYINSDHKSYITISDINENAFNVFRKDIITRQALLACVKVDLPRIFNGLDSFDGLDLNDINKMINERHGELLNDWLRR